MRLLLDVPSGWQWQAAPGRDLYRLPQSPMLTVEVGPIVQTPELPDDLVTRGLPPWHQVRSLRHQAHVTADGWPMLLQEAELCDPSDNLVEARLVARYTFLMYATAVLVRCDSAQLLAEQRAAIVAVLERARPELRSGRPVALAQLFSMEESL